jgi:mannose-6-phosphate isomerase-like protein (cupin superfamily)
LILEKNTPAMPDASIGLVANLWSKMMHFKKAGDTEQGHAHVFDHLTLLAKGSMRVTVDGTATDFKAPHMIYIKKEAVHELVALEDDTLAYCIHALRDGDGVDDIIDPSMIPGGGVPDYKPLIY